MKLHILQSKLSLVVASVILSFTSAASPAFAITTNKVAFTPADTKINQEIQVDTSKYLIVQGVMTTRCRKISSTPTKRIVRCQRYQRVCLRRIGSRCVRWGSYRPVGRPWTVTCTRRHPRLPWRCRPPLPSGVVIR